MSQLSTGHVVLAQHARDLLSLHATVMPDATHIMIAVVMFLLIV